MVILKEFGLAKMVTIILKPLLIDIVKILNGYYRYLCDSRLKNRFQWEKNKNKGILLKVFWGFFLS